MGTLGGFPNPPAMLRGEQSSPAPHAFSWSSVCSLTQAAPSPNLEAAGVADEGRHRLPVAVEGRTPGRFAQRRLAGVAEPERALRHDDQIADLALGGDARLQDGLAGRALLARGFGVMAFQRVVE